MRIAIVNDSLMAVEAMRRVLSETGEHRVAWIARDGAEAVELCAKDRPDLILMDLIMPKVDGVEATRRIMSRSPCAIVVVTVNVGINASKVYEAMGAGALDAVNTPVLERTNKLDGSAALLAKVNNIGSLISSEAGKNILRQKMTARPVEVRHKKLVAIGASAGGPAALAKILAGLPVTFPAAIVIVQHVDSHFAEGLSHWLAQHTQLQVRLAKEGDQPTAGTALLAGRDRHLVFSNGTKLGYTRSQIETSYCPSINVFFRSVQQHWQGEAVGVLLTGMGRDGAEGLRALRDRGFHTIAQNEASSAVYGMPKAALELKAASEVLALDKIAPRLTNIFIHKTTHKMKL